MELKEYIAMFRRWWWLLLVGVLVGGGIGYITNRPGEPIYQAKTTLIIGDFIQNGNAGDLATSQRLAQSYAEMIRREPILRVAIEELDLPMDWTALRGAVNGRLVPNTQLFEIYVTSSDPDQAKALADEVANQLILQSASATEPDPEEDSYRDFVRRQLEDLQEKIMTGQQQLQEMEATLDLETTAEGLRQRQEEISALQTKLSNWQNTYASLLTFIQQDRQEATDQLKIIEPAILSQVPINTGEIRSILLGVMVGLSLTAGGVYLLEYLDDTLKTADDVQRVMKLPALGAIPQLGSKFKLYGRTDSTKTPENFSPLAEAYRVLRTNLQFSSLLMTNASSTLLVTSPGASEGKSTTVANLGLVMAQAGKRVILVDADLRRPNLHKLFDLPGNEPGLTDLLRGKDVSLETALVKTPVADLRILPSGSLLANPADMLVTPQMKQLVAELTEQCDLVIFDSPPLLVVTDASLLAAQVDGALLVIEAGKTRSQVCLRSQEIVEQIGGKLLGVVLNRFNPRRDASYGYGYYYYNYYYGENGRGSPKRRSNKQAVANNNRPEPQ